MSGPRHGVGSRALEVVNELAAYLYETMERLDPGADAENYSWDKLTDSEKAFYCELVWAFLGRKNLISEFLNMK